MKKIIYPFFAVLIVNSAFAQTRDSSNQLNEVIVTANKIEQKQNTTGKVITVITKEELEKSAGKTVAQVLNEQAGLVINGALNNPGSVQTVYMRGANAGRVLILIDGIPVNDPSDINNNFDLNLISVNDVERIEIAKGAQSTLYGSDAEAGVINIITNKKNVQKLFNLDATAAGGNLGTYKGNVQLYGKANKFSYTLRYAKLKTKGFSSAYDSTEKNNFDKDGYNGNSTNATFKYQATDNLMFHSFVMYNQYKTDLDASGFTDDKYYTANNNDLITGAGFQFKKNVVTLTGNYQFSQLNRRYKRDSLDKNVSPYFLKNNYFGKSQYAELYANIQLGSGFSLLEGSDFRWNSMNQNYISVSPPFPPYTTTSSVYNSSFKDTSMSQSSLYSSLMYNSEKLNVELGGRVNVHSRYGNNYTYTFNPSYNFNEHFRIFGSIATGYKAPSIYQLFLDPSIGGNPDLQPEKSINYEFGLQQKLSGFTHRLVGFYRHVKNGIDYKSADYPAPSSYFNFAKQIVKGIEYEFSLQPTDKLSIAGNYTFLSGKETTQSRIDFADTSYNHLLRRPKHDANLNIGYQFTSKFYLSANGKYVSKRYDVGGYMIADELLKSYFLLNAYGEYKFCEKLKIFADAENIFNKKFFDMAGYNSIPFEITAGVSIKL